MALFREENLTIQDDYLRVNSSGEEQNNLYKSGPDEDDFDDEDDLDTEEVDEEEIEDISSQIDPLDDEDELDDDDDLLDDDDDDLDSPIVPDLDEEDDLLDDDDDLLDDDDDDLDDDTVARTTIDSTGSFAERPHGRTSGTMIDHEPGLPG